MVLFACVVLGIVVWSGVCGASSMGSVRNLDKLKYEPTITRAQCQAACLEMYSTQNNSTLYAFYTDLYVPHPCTSKECKECMNPCTIDYEITLDGCLWTCYGEGNICEESCKRLNVLKTRNAQTNLPRSAKRLQIDSFIVICRSMMVSSLNSNVTYGKLFLRWNVITPTNQRASEPITFILAYRTNANHSWSVLRETPDLSLQPSTNESFPSTFFKFQTEHSFKSINKLRKGTPYQFQLVAVDSDGIIGEPAISTWNTTLTDINRTPSPPRNVHLIQQEVHKKRVRAVIGWDPPPEMLCHYYIYWMPTTKVLGAPYGQRKISIAPEFKYEVDNLDFGITYLVRMYSYLHDGADARESNVTQSSFVTMPCLTSTNYSYSTCAPEKPYNLSCMIVPLTSDISQEVSSGTELTSANDTAPAKKVDVIVSWQPPPYTSPTNKIEKYKLQLRLIPALRLSSSVEPHFDETEISGNLTKLRLYDLYPGSIYKIWITAVTLGGESEKAWISFNTSIPRSKGDGSNLTDTGQTNLRLAQAGGELSILYIIFILFGIIFFGIILSVVVAFYNRKRKKGYGKPMAPVHSTELANARRPSQVPLSPLSRQPSDEAPLVTSPGLDEYEIDFGSLILGQELGQGAFGRVLKGYMKYYPNILKQTSDGKSPAVAVKLTKEFATPEDHQNLLKEIKLMKHLGRHRNIVGIVACCTKGPRTALIMDFCEHGDLRNYLRKIRERHCPKLNLAPKRRVCESIRSGQNAVIYNYNLASSQTGEYEYQRHGGGGSGRPMYRSDSGVPYSLVGSHGRIRSASDGRPRVPSRRSIDRDGSKGSYSSQGGSYGSASTEWSTLPSTAEEEEEEEEEEEDDEISVTKLMSYAWQISVGMEYLAQKKFVHRDLAARNVLVSSDNQVKISDFGLTRDIYENSIYHKSTSGKLPLKWMSIEAIFDQVYTIKSDVWSFGIILWEIVTLGGSPYPGIPSKDLFKLLKEGYRNEKPENCSQEIYELMLACWHPCPGDRPCFTTLRSKLESILEDRRPYMDFNIEGNSDYYKHYSSSSCSNEEPPVVSTKKSEDDARHADNASTSSAESTVILETKLPKREMHNPPAPGLIVNNPGYESHVVGDNRLSDPLCVEQRLDGVDNDSVFYSDSEEHVTPTKVQSQTTFDGCDSTPLISKSEERKPYQTNITSPILAQLKSEMRTPKSCESLLKNRLLKSVSQSASDLDKVASHTRYVQSSWRSVTDIQLKVGNFNMSEV